MALTLVNVTVSRWPATMGWLPVPPSASDASPAMRGRGPARVVTAIGEVGFRPSHRHVYLHRFPLGDDDE